MRERARAVVVAAVLICGASALSACAPTIDGPAERQRELDRTDAARLAAQLARLPGAVSADVTLRRPVVDPFSGSASPASAAIVVVVDDQADREAVTRAAAALARGTAPEIAEPAIVVEVGATRPTLVDIGPFRVDARSKRGVVTALAAAFAFIAALAAWIAWRERWRVSAG